MHRLLDGSLDRLFRGDPADTHPLVLQRRINCDSLSWVRLWVCLCVTIVHIIPFPRGHAMAVCPGPLCSGTRGVMLKLRRHDKRACLLYTSDAADEL